MSLCGGAWGIVNVVVGVPTLWGQRNFIINFFNEGDHVASMGDDIDEPLHLIPDSQGGRLEPLPRGGLFELVAEARQQLVKDGAHIWALSTSANPRCMDVRAISRRNGNCNGYFWGCFIRHAPQLYLQYGDGHEDVERSVRFYDFDGVVIRFRAYCARTRCKRNRGGLQSTMSSLQRQAEEAKCADSLVSEFPHLLLRDCSSQFGVKFCQPNRRHCSRTRCERNNGGPSALEFEALVQKQRQQVLDGAQWIMRADERRGVVRMTPSLGLYLKGEASSSDLGHCSAAVIYKGLQQRTLIITWLPENASDAVAPSAGWLVPPGKRRRLSYSHGEGWWTLSASSTSWGQQGDNGHC